MSYGAKSANAKVEKEVWLSHYRRKFLIAIGLLLPVTSQSPLLDLGRFTVQFPLH